MDKGKGKYGTLRAQKLCIILKKIRRCRRQTNRYILCRPEWHKIQMAGGNIKRGRGDDTALTYTAIWENRIKRPLQGLGKYSTNTLSHTPAGVAIGDGSRSYNPGRVAKKRK